MVVVMDAMYFCYCIGGNATVLLSGRYSIALTNERGGGAIVGGTLTAAYRVRDIGFLRADLNSQKGMQ